MFMHLDAPCYIRLSAFARGDAPRGQLMGMALLAALAALIAATATHAADPATVQNEIVASQPTFKVEVQTSRAVHTVDVSTWCPDHSAAIFTPIRLYARSDGVYPILSGRPLSLCRVHASLARSPYLVGLCLPLWLPIDSSLSAEPERQEFCRLVYV